MFFWAGNRGSVKNDSSPSSSSSSSSSNIDHELAKLKIYDSSSSSDDDEIISYIEKKEIVDGEVIKDEKKAIVAKIDSDGNVIKTDVYINTQDEPEHHGKITVNKQPINDINQLKDMDHSNFSEVLVCEHIGNIKKAIKTYFDGHYFSNPESKHYILVTIDYCKRIIERDQMFIKFAFQKILLDYKEYVLIEGEANYKLNLYIAFILKKLSQIFSEFELVYDILNHTEKIILKEHDKRESNSDKHKHTIKGEIRPYIKKAFFILFLSLATKVSELLKILGIFIRRNKNVSRYFGNVNKIPLYDISRCKRVNVNDVKDINYKSDIIGIANFLESILINLSKQWRAMFGGAAPEKKKSIK